MPTQNSTQTYEMLKTYLDETADSFEKLRVLHSLKTGALMEASCLLGYYAAGNDVNPEIEAKLAENGGENATTAAALEVMKNLLQEMQKANANPSIAQQLESTLDK